MLQDVLLLHALEPAGLRVPSVLQGASLLLQTHHLVLAEASQEPVQLPDGHGHQLLVGEVCICGGPSVLSAVRLLLQVVLGAQHLRRLRRGAPQVFLQIGVLSDALHVWVVLLHRVAQVSVALVLSLERLRVVVPMGPGRVSLLRRGTDQSLHCVLWRQPKRLRVHLLWVPPAVGYPELVGVISLLARVEVRGRGHRVARGAPRGGGDGVRSLQLDAGSDEGAVHPLHGFLLHPELHQVVLADKVHVGFVQTQMRLGGHVRYSAGTGSLFTHIHADTHTHTAPILSTASSCSHLTLEEMDGKSSSKSKLFIQHRRGAKQPPPTLTELCVLPQDGTHLWLHGEERSVFIKLHWHDVTPPRLHLQAALQ